jgi:hypothetical protein
MSFKTASKLMLLLVSLGVVLPMVAVYIVDPYQIYHQRIIFKNAGYGTEEFYQHAGWINQVLADPAENYQALVIGPSTMSNYTSSMINSALSWGKTLNLSYHGGFPKMSAATASYALSKNRNIKHILWDIHLYYASNDPNYVGDTDFPYYLYNNKLMDDYPYLFNATNVLTAFRFMRGDYGGFGRDIEHNGPFYEDLVAAKRFDIFRSVDYRRTVMQPTIYHHAFSPLDASSIAALNYPSIDQNLLQIIMPLCNSNTDITLIFSPYTRFFYVSSADEHYIYSLIYMRRYVIGKVSSCQNIKVFSYDNEDSITADLNHYADNFHFDLDINHYILSSFAEQRNRLTPANIDEYEKTFMQKLNEYPDLFASQLDH